MGHLRCGMVDGVEPLRGEDALDQRAVTQVSDNGRQSGHGCIVIGHQIDIDDGMAFAKQAAFQDAAKESRGPGYKNIRHLD